MSLRASTNGTTWQPLCGKYTTTGTSSQISGAPVYDGIQNTWVKEQVNLADFVGQQLYLRFRLKSDGSVTGDGFYFDDFSVKSLSAAAMAVADAGSQSIKIYPNPASDKLFVKNQGRFTSYKIHSVTGQLLQQGKTDGSVEISKLGNGVYFIELSDGATLIREKFVVKK